MNVNKTFIATTFINVATCVYICRKLGEYYASITEAMAELKKDTRSGTIAPSPLTASTQCNTDVESEFVHVRCYDRPERDFFHDKRAAELVYDKTIVHLQESQTIKEALQEMHTSKTTSGLVYAENEFIGLIDTIDVVRSILNPLTIDCTVRRMLRNCFVANENVTVNELIAHLRHGIRYIATVTNDGTMQMVSQRAIMRMIFEKNCNDIDVFQKTLDELNLGKNKPIHCGDTETARSAFEIIGAYGFTSLPIVNADGDTVSVISASNIFYARESTKRLDLPILRYVEESRRDACISRAVNCIVSCRASDELGTVLRLMLHEQVHHVYVLEENKTIGVVSFVDILRVV